MLGLYLAFLEPFHFEMSENRKIYEKFDPKDSVKTNQQVSSILKSETINSFGNILKTNMSNIDKILVEQYGKCV